MSKKSCLFLYMESLYKNLQDILDILYLWLNCKIRNCHISGFWKTREKSKRYTDRLFFATSGRKIMNYLYEEKMEKFTTIVIIRKICFTNLFVSTKTLWPIQPSIPSTIFTTEPHLQLTPALYSLTKPSIPSTMFTTVAHLQLTPDLSSLTKPSIPSTIFTVEHHSQSYF